MNEIIKAQERIKEVVEMQLERLKKMKENAQPVDYKSKEKIIIGTVGGDGIGPTITAEAVKILEKLLKSDIEKGRIEIRNIDDLTIENRLKVGKAIPDEILEKLLACDVILKGPTTTPEKTDATQNIESANVAMRKALDLFANVRPVKVPELGIDWTFFRENTEGAYAVGNMGIDVNDDLAIDFTITTTTGSERIIRKAFEYARANGKTRVSAVTKANVIKATDGKFLEVCKRISAEYPEINYDSWYMDIITAKLIDDKRRRDFQVFVLPNLYGDILTDEAAEIQGGVGTAGSANVGTKYAMFEAIHGSAPRMVTEGRAQYADPSSIIKAGAMLLNHIGYIEESDKLEKALEISNSSESKVKMTGRDGAVASEKAEYIMSLL